ncbi:MAG: HD domain-containing phosphohydrolase [Chloroflexota bacterium]
MTEEKPVEVLLVEDEPAHAELVSRAFESYRQKYTLLVAQTVAEARMALKDHAPALIISDWRLPDGEGVELISPPEETDGIPVIIMASHGNERVAVEVIKAGALDYVVKSDAALAEMAHTVERALREWEHRTQRQRAERELERRLAELETINRVSTAMRTAEGLHQMIPLLLDEALAILGARAGIFWLYDSAAQKLKPILARGEFSKLEGEPLAPGEGIPGRVFLSAGVHITQEICSDPLSSAKSSAQMPPGWGGVCVPIRTAQEVIGVLMVGFEAPRRFNDNQVNLLNTMAEIAGNAIHRTHLYEQREHGFRRMAALRAIDQAITSNTDLNLTLNILAHHAKTQLGVDAVAIMRLNPHSNMLEFIAGHGFSHPSGVPRASTRVGDGYAGLAVLERRPIFAPDLKKSALPGVHPELSTTELFQAYHVIPLIIKGQVKGVLEAFHRSPFQPDAEWANFFESLAGQAAIAIDNADLFEGIQRTNMELILAYDATIEGWSRALDLRDRETEGHTQRVTEMTIKLATIMGISGEEIIHIRRGALLHDIGKMGIPDNLLLKTGPLTDNEWGEMRKHPVYAYEMLSPISYLRPALDIPYCHHERWDGTGYPRGLKGERIPLSARIFAVVDVWDALCSDRPYRRAWSREKALEYLTENSGAHFDPAVVSAFKRMLG